MPEIEFDDDSELSEEELKAKQLLDPTFRNKFDLEIKTGKLGIDKITPSQVDRVPGLSDSAKKFFAKGEEVAPFVIDRNGNLVNGHHRYDAAKMLGVKRVPIIAVNRTIHELVELFGPGSKYNMASQTGTVDARKVKGFKGLKPIDTVDPRSVAAQKGWDTRRRRMNKGQQQLDFGDDFKDISQDMEMEEDKMLDLMHPERTRLKQSWQYDKFKSPIENFTNWFREKRRDPDWKHDEQSSWKLFSDEYYGSF